MGSWDLAFSQVAHPYGSAKYMNTKESIKGSITNFVSTELRLFCNNDVRRHLPADIFFEAMKYPDIWKEGNLTNCTIVMDQELDSQQNNTKDSICTCI
ncbi:MAG: hypothetical protein EZS28_039179 [Streblomastix strix]|uniref:Uncharacterized protein n=1 Tax=Streblomastix strix TaxID=222440 RepID=A0A5J4U4N9_9EUKA|nr:MAG: hypothetical protein EZS28_039179 [Streblomastix strix]